MDSCIRSRFADGNQFSMGAPAGAPSNTPLQPMAAGAASVVVMRGLSEGPPATAERPVHRPVTPAHEAILPP